MSIRRNTAIVSDLY